MGEASFLFVIGDKDSVPFDDSTVRLIGGKAIGLHRLRHLGIAVPSWSTFTTNLFQRFSDQNDVFRRILADSYSDDEEKATVLRNYLSNIDLDTFTKEILDKEWRKISKEGTRAVAIRSSASDEDSPELSFAGQMDSFLNMRSQEDVYAAVRSCWASLFSKRGVHYRAQHGLDPWSVRIAVIIQEMLNPDVSGVIFTANILNGNRKEMLVNSTWGLGEGLVSGRLESDTFILDTDAAVLDSRVAEKRLCIKFGIGGGTEAQAVPEDGWLVPSLERNQLRTLGALARKTQDFMGMPVDIEFCVLGSNIYFLQARPITGLKECETSLTSNYCIWDNSNIVESYADITLPLTFSFIRKAYCSVYRQFCEILGVDQRTIEINRRMFENMLGLIKGRVYYNLLNWYKIVSFLPGFSYNRKFFEQMVGLRVVKDLQIARDQKSIFERYLLGPIKLARVAAGMVVNHLTLQRRVKAFHKHFEEIYRYYCHLDYERKTPTEILELYHILEKEVLSDWKAPILNDLEAMIFYGVLKRLTQRWSLDVNGTLQNDLLCGDREIKSTKVTTELFRVARSVSENKELRELFLTLSPAEVLFKLRNEPDYAIVRDAFDAYLADYGVRSVGELKLESTPVKDNPLFCVTMIQNYLRSSIPDEEDQRVRDEAKRQAAEQLLKERIKSSYAHSAFLRLPIYRWVLQKTRNAIRNRENQRFARAEGYDLVRQMVRALGKYWTAKGVLADSQDIFYLEMEELWSFIDGTSTCTNLKGLVALRKEEFEAYRMATPPDHIETYGEIYLDNTFEQKVVREGESEILRGLGCCQGLIQGPIQVVEGPDAASRLNGEILVAKQTDPGWVVFFPSISGLIIEKGSPLSHSAIVAREMGIPTVVAVKDATRILKTGDIVRLDGSAGEVKIVRRGLD